MAKLKSRTKFPPKGFFFEQPQTKWRTGGMLSFDACVGEVLAYRNANPQICAKFNLSIDRETVVSEVENFTCQRGLAEGWFNAYCMGDPPFFPLAGATRLYHHENGSVAANVENLIGGVKTLFDWVGDGGQPVTKELAEERAKTCVACQFNQDRGKLIDYFTAPVAAALNKILAVKNHLNLKTSLDDKLHICTACDCQLKTKVWTPLTHIQKEMSPETFGKLDPACWVINEKREYCKGYEPGKLDLSNVTLWSCVWSEDWDLLDKTMQVLRYCWTLCKFERVIIFTCLPLKCDCPFEVVTIPKLNAQGWNLFFNREIPTLIKGQFAMFVHEDGFIIEPSMWTPEFLKYDYIGAPWPEGEVGNGGFSLQSRKMMDETLKLPIAGCAETPADNFTCRIHRQRLIDAGVKFAPPEVAWKFSTEMNCQNIKSFGFHHRFCNPKKYVQGWKQIKKKQ